MKPHPKVDPQPTMRVVVCEPDKPAEVREVEKSTASMQALVGGYFDCVRVLGGYDCWIHDEGRLIGLPPNRLVSATATVRRVHGQLGLTTGDDGGPAWDLLGTFFIAKSDGFGRTVGLDADEAELLANLFTGSTSVCRPLKPEEVQPAEFKITFES